MKMLIIALVTVFSVSAFAQKHMVNFSNDSLVVGDLNFSNSKSNGSNKSDSVSFSIKANYAYSLTAHMQLGTKINYAKGEENNNDEFENYGLFVGGIYNLDTDFRKSMYASLYVGWAKDNSYPNVGSSNHAEQTVAEFAVGKRFPLTSIGFENLTYSPEVSYTATNFTTSNTADWAQNVKFTFLKFAVFF